MRTLVSPVTGALFNVLQFIQGRSRFSSKLNCIYSRDSMNATEVATQCEPKSCEAAVASVFRENYSHEGPPRIGAL